MYRHFSKPTGFIFPARSAKTPEPSVTQWSSSLITMAKIQDLYHQKPWDIYDHPVQAISFQPGKWFQGLIDIYGKFSRHHGQALWEASHNLPISFPLKRRDPRLAPFAHERKQRRSRSGPRCKKVLAYILKGMVEGHCDLDILLDPMFLHFPRAGEDRIWYPGLVGNRTNIPNLITALHMCDASEPRRIQFRRSMTDHPGAALPRLVGKFFPRT